MHTVDVVDVVERKGTLDMLTGALIGAGIGLGHGIDGNKGPVAEPWKVLLFLFLGAVLPDRHDTREQMGTHREDQSRVFATISERFESNRGRERVEASSAVLFRDREAE